MSSEDEASVIVHLADPDSQQSNHSFSKLFHNFPRQLNISNWISIKSLQNPVTFATACVQRLTTAMLHSTN